MFRSIDNAGTDVRRPLVKMKTVVGERAVICVALVQFGNGNRVARAVDKFQRVLLRRGMVIHLDQPGFIQYALFD
ncbi:UNVERIFIED_ORG: hypothetical protein BDU10_5819 [Burkholderia sp. CF145]